MSSAYEGAAGADDASYIELQSFSPKPQHSSLSTEYDQATLLGHGNSRGFPSTTLNSNVGIKARILSILDSVLGSQKWKYLEMKSSLYSSPSSSHPFRGWRKSVVAAAIVTTFVLFVNAIFAMVVRAKFPADNGIGVFYTGSCTLVKRWDTAIHLLINVLGTCLLAASSFTMQCLSSPTRSEADAAHAKRRPLEIGIPSFLNLFHMRKWKMTLWLTLCFSTLPLHLLWNSTVFSTLGANEVAYIIVDEAFLSGSNYTQPVMSSCSSSPSLGYSSYVFTDAPSPQTYLAGYRAGNYTKLTTADCIQEYSASFMTGYGKFMAVTESSSASTKLSPGCAFASHWSVNLTAWYGSEAGSEYYYYNSDHPEPLANGSSLLAYQNIGSNQYPGWLCYGYDDYFVDKGNSYFSSDYDTVRSCDVAHAKSLLQDNGSWYLRPHEPVRIYPQYMQAYQIDYCLAEVDDVDRCQLQYVSYILYIVIVCNAIKVAAMCAAAYWLWDLNEPILATVGDAVVSYMEKPDETTAGWCLMDFREVLIWRHRRSRPVGGQIYDRKPKTRLYSATSKTRWWTTVTLCTLYLIIGCGLLVPAIRIAQTAYSISQVWQLGLGAVNSNTVLTSEGLARGSQILSSILVANVFQLALSTTYFLYNSLYTAQCGALEWASYASSARKSLRVTWPQGQQRSTYYLHLPYRYGLPLTTFLMLLHFLISQSIFLASVQWYNDGVLDEEEFIAGVGLSPIAILITCCIGAALILAQVVHSFRWMDNRLPIHGNCSAAISAMCHTSNGVDENDNGAAPLPPEENMAMKGVMWGVTKESAVVDGGSIGLGSSSSDVFGMPAQYDDTRTGNNADTVDAMNVGHCAFTAAAVELPVQGRRYQ